MSQPPRFNLHPVHQVHPEYAYRAAHPAELPRQGAVIGGIGSAFASPARAFQTNLFGSDAFPFRGGMINPDQVVLRPADRRPVMPGPPPVVEYPAPVAPTPEQLKEREEHKKAFYELYSSNYRDVEYKKTKLIQKGVHTEATRVLTILKSGRHPSESDVEGDSASFRRHGAGGAAGPSGQDADSDRAPDGQPRKRARKMPRRFYHYTRVYMLHNYSGTVALAYRPDSAAAEGNDADNERAGKPPRMVTCFEDVFDAMADVHYKKDYHVKVGLTEKVLRDMYYNIPRNCVKAFVQTCRCQTSRIRRDVPPEEERRVVARKSPPDLAAGAPPVAPPSTGLKGLAGRSRLTGCNGAVVWLTGPSRAGKSTIACLLEERLLERAVLLLHLDPTSVGHGLCSDLGFSRLARAETLRRVTEVAKHVCEAGLVAVTSFVSPLRVERAAAREAFRQTQRRFFEVHVTAPAATLKARGAEAAAQSESSRAEDSYEEPTIADLTLDTDALSPEDCVHKLIRLLEVTGVLVRGAARRFIREQREAEEQDEEEGAAARHAPPKQPARPPEEEGEGASEGEEEDTTSSSAPARHPPPHQHHHHHQHRDIAPGALHQGVAAGPRSRPMPTHEAGSALSSGAPPLREGPTESLHSGWRGVKREATASPAGADEPELRVPRTGPAPQLETGLSPRRRPAGEARSRPSATGSMAAGGPPVRALHAAAPPDFDLAAPDARDTAPPRNAGDLEYG